MAGLSCRTTKQCLQHGLVNAASPKLNPHGGSAVASNDGDGAPARRRGGYDQRFAPPAALGYTPSPPPPPPAFFSLFSGKPAGSQGSSHGRRYQGNTTNDVIMRALGGF